MLPCYLKLYPRSLLTPGHGVEPRGPAVQSPNSYSGATGLPADVESNVWTIGVTNDLNPSWVNSDGSVATTSTFYVPGDGTFVITGDAEAFASMFGATAINAAVRYLLLIPKDLRVADLLLDAYVDVHVCPFVASFRYPWLRACTRQVQGLQ